MKTSLLFLATILVTVVPASAAVWNYPLNGNTVGNPTYFDCTAPGTPNYMKLWIHGSSTSLWTVHGTNHLVFVYNLPAGTYEMDCQYNDGTTHDNFITITVAENLYDAANVDDDAYNQGEPTWVPVSGCGTDPTCSVPTYNSSVDLANNTDGQSRWFSATAKSGTGTQAAQDVYFYEKRCGGDAVIGQRAGHYMVNFNAEADPSLPVAFEFGFTQWYNGTNYRMAFQADYNSSHWRMFNPATGSWVQTNVTLSQAPIPTTTFKRVYLVGHPYTSGGERVAADAIQIGECTNAPCADTDSDPVRPVAITNVNVSAFSESCHSTEGNSQSVQIDVNRTNPTFGKIWTDKYYVHLQP